MGDLFGADFHPVALGRCLDRWKRCRMSRLLGHWLSLGLAA